MHKEAARAEAVILMISFPTRMDIRRRRGFSSSAWTRPALGCFDSLSWCSLVDSREKRAVSDPEKKAEKQSRKKIETILITITISKSVYCGKVLSHKEKMIITQISYRVWFLLVIENNEFFRSVNFANLSNRNVSCCA